MNKLMRKTAAVLMAAAVSATGLSATSFAADQCPHCGGSLGTDTISVEYGASVAKPTYKIKGTKGTRKIRLSTTTSGAIIYYTTDGSNPTTKSNRYTGLITIKKNTKIKAIAVKGSDYSSVMTKTVRVATVLGDVTGDGSVNESDYSRLISWIDGETSYGCKDNADVSGNGKVNRTDAKYLRQYLDGEIDSFPAGGGSSSSSSSSSTSSSIKKPTITVYKSYGGKKIQLDTDTSGATIYYTLNGSDPTKNSTKYTGTFMLEKDATIKAVAYKNGKYSTVKSRDVEVDQCATPTSDMDENKQYTDSVKITLSCATPDSRIYYTTDGSDPVRYGKHYTDPIVLTSNATLKIFAEAKGHTNSAVRTYNYKVISTNFTISGMVWNDTPTETTKADGIKQYGERGINGITVKLVNTATNNVEQTATTTTINGIEGSYILDRAKAGNTYKVTFDFNGQKYRAFGSIVSGGNQAISQTVTDLVIRNNGAYTLNNQLVAAVNNLNSAAVSAQFSLSATTNATYRAAAANVNLALASNIYGDLNVKFVDSIPRGQSVYSGDALTYNFSVINDSPYQTLKSAKLNFYLDPNLSIQRIYLASGYGNSNISYSAAGSAMNGLQKYVIDCPAIEANGGYSTIAVETVVNRNIRDGVQIKNYVEVAEYCFTGACFDKNSTPGNFNNYVRESDEAESATVTGYSSKAASQTLKFDRTTATIGQGQSATFNFTITNATWDDLHNITVTQFPNSNLTIGAPSASEVRNGVLFGTITVYGNAATQEWVYFNLNGAGTDKQIAVQITVQAPPAAQ